MSEPKLNLSIRKNKSTNIQEAAALAVLYGHCETIEDILPWPNEIPECLLYYTLEEDEDSGVLTQDLVIIAALALFRIDENTCELKMMTQPDFRCLGLFSSLAGELMDLEEYEETDFLVNLRDIDTEAISAVEAQDAAKIGEDFRMEISLSGDFKKPSSASLKKSHLSMQVTSQEEPSALNYRFSYEGDVSVPDAAICQTALFDGGACFYDFAVEPSLRGHGIGKNALNMVLADLADRGIDRVWLHVSSDNTPAVSLYKKTGFRITETLCEYLL